MMFDLSKCYERIPLLELAVRAREAGWPGKMVALAVSQYAAVRWVAVAEAVTPAGYASHGMVAGCAWAVKFLADYLRPRLRSALAAPPMQWADQNIPRNEGQDVLQAMQDMGLAKSARTYVDDIRLEVRGPFFFGGR